MIKTAKKLTSNLYVTEDIKYFPKEHTHRYVELPDGRLFAMTGRGFWATKVTEQDLPEWYIKGRYYKRWGWLNAKDIKYVKYRPVPFPHNHVLRDDFLLVSYDEPIRKKMDSYGIDNYVYDLHIYGNEIINILNAMKKYSGYDIEPVKEEIWQKILTLKDVQGWDDSSYYDEIKMSREKFASWWD